MRRTRFRAIDQPAQTARTARIGRIGRIGAALLTAGALAACGGADDAQEPPAEQLAKTKAKVDAAKSMHLTLRSSGIPATANGVLGAEGSGTHAPAFKGTLDGRINGVQAKVEVVAINKVTYVKLPFTTEFVTPDLSLFDAPDPAQLFATKGGISSLLTSTVNPVEGPKTRAGSEVLTTITGTLPGASVKELLSVGEGVKTFKVTYGITDPGDELRTVTMTGPFYKDAKSKAVTSTYVLTLDKYGAPVEISKP